MEIDFNGLGSVKLGKIHWLEIRPKSWIPCSLEDYPMTQQMNNFLKNLQM